MKFIVDRSKWAQAGVPEHISGQTMLRNSFTGFRCCLGFLAEKCGYTNKELDTLGFPSTVAAISKKDLWPAGVKENEGLFISINDNKHISNEQRETGLVSIFSKVNIEVEFTGKYPA